MKIPTILRALLRGEVDAVEYGTDHINAMREREAERLERAELLRASAHRHHPELPAAMRMRRKAMKGDIGKAGNG